MSSYIVLLLIASVLIVTNAVDLKCKFYSEDWRNIPKSQTCQGENVVITEREVITSVNDNNDFSEIILSLSIEHQTVYFFPKGIGNFFPNLSEIRIHNSQLKTLDRNDLRPFLQLEQLSLIRNSLKVLENNLFQYTPNLKSVDFDGNKLIAIGSEILSSLQNLVVADFQNNKCINFRASSSGQIINLSNSIKVDCEDPDLLKQILFSDDSILRHKFGNLAAATKNLKIISSELEKCKDSSKDFVSTPQEEQKVDVSCRKLMTIEKGICFASELKVPFATYAIENVYHEGGEIISTENLTALHVYGQETFFLPNNFANFFSNLTKVFIRRSGLYLIDSNTFKNMKQLTVLDLSHNMLLDIPVGSFSDQTKLLHLELSFNNIQTLQTDVFKSQVKLESLHFTGNNLLALRSKVFENLVNLKVLLLDFNQIATISADLFVPMQQLTTVNLMHNLCINSSYPEKSLQEIENEIIDNCIAPIEFRCKFENISNESEQIYNCKAEDFSIEYPRTKISKVNGDHQVNLTLRNVTKLEIFNQSIKFLPLHFGKHFPSLENLFIEESNLNHLLKTDFDDFAELKQIVIRHNNLSSIEGNSFDKMSKLTRLDLSDNNIQSLPSKVFSRLLHMKFLSLSNNKLKKFTADLLPMRNSIEILNADNNELEFVETKILRYLRKSNLIDLTGNVCIDLKFDKSNKTTKTLIELSGEIDLNCSLDETECNC